MRELGYVATVAAFQTPTALVLLVGLVLAATAGRRLPRKPRLLAMSGLTVLLVNAVLSVAWTLLLPRAFDFDWGRSNFQLMNMAYGGLQSLTYPIGTGLLIAAVLAGRRARGAEAGPFGDGGRMPAGQPVPGAQPVPPAGAQPVPPAGQPVPGAQPVPPAGAGWDAAGGADVPAQWDGRSRPDAPTGTAPDRP
ncbi:hypothetical protein GA0070610_0661 [Micromonospora echinofusca]|uniref:Uncharacterized protein n=1 Tax=Micromonospora echinofusca TaxID=47858 RepID=A0A1C5G3T6_MICEH|nr:hypothetical protein [Micromonospora echinofusca]SCG14457.1 hypothetical protein GA0070610_0661 [Micromonospora echinofusca]